MLGRHPNPRKRQGRLSSGLQFLNSILSILYQLFVLWAVCQGRNKKAFSEKKNIVHSVETLTVQNRIREVCSMREDTLGAEVFGRLSSINDLIAEEAVYHKDCYINFLKPTS